jgi:hypothetical protein
MVEVTKFKLVAATNFRAEPFELIDLIVSLTGVRPVSSNLPCVLAPKGSPSARVRIIQAG